MKVNIGYVVKMVVSILRVLRQASMTGFNFCYWTCEFTSLKAFECRWLDLARGKKLIAIKAIIDNHWQSCINLLIESDCHFAKWWKQEVISEKAKIHYLIMKIAKAIVGNHWQSLTICANHWQSLQVKKIIFRLTSEPVIAILFRNDNRMYFQKILELVIG